MLAAFFAGAIPALRAFRLSPMDVLKDASPKGTAGIGERRLLRGVAMLQTSLTMALLIGAGLLIRTMIKISDVPSGYNISRILTMSVTEVQSQASWGPFHRQALERVAAQSQVSNMRRLHGAFRSPETIGLRPWTLRASRGRLIGAT